MGGSSGITAVIECEMPHPKESNTLPLYYSCHVTACLTKQALRQLMNDVFQAGEVKVRRAVASQLGGRMLLEVEASDLITLEKWIGAKRLNAEWVMRIDLEGDRNAVQEH